MTVREKIIKLNEEIQNFEYINDVGLLTRMLPDKLVQLAGFMKEQVQENKDLSKFVYSNSSKWLIEEAEDLRSLIKVIDKEKRLLWLKFSKKWTKESVNMFFYHCEYFDKKILDKTVLE